MIKKEAVVELSREIRREILAFETSIKKFLRPLEIPSKSPPTRLTKMSETADALPKMTVRLFRPRFSGDAL
jgi:hypothetical protein